MFDTNEVVAEYTTEAEAQVALEQLREEGIEGEVKGVGGELIPVAPFRLFVVAENALKARQVLGLHRQEAGEEGWEDEAESAVDGQWICGACDAQVPLDQDVCPECGTPRSEARAEGDEKEG
jgi:hypothetical protein